MSSRIVLDTNAYSELSRGNTEILDVLSQAERTYIPVTVLGELFAGFRGGNQEQRNRTQLKRFLQKPSVRVLHTTEEVADHYSHIIAALKAKKAPIPTNDVWIAAHAMDRGAVLITFDKHFHHVDGLRRWK